MKASNDILEFIKIQEGFRSIAYKPLPTDRWTYGYGSTFKLDGSPVNQGDTITKEDASILIKKVIDRLAVQLSYSTNPNCTQNQFDAFLSLCYNCGLGAVMSSTTGLMFKNGEDISDRFSLWRKSGGRIIEDLVTRREKEQGIYDKGVYT